MRLYTTYEEPLRGRVFTEKQMHEVYRDLANKSEYPDFDGWLYDMLKSGVFEEVEGEAQMQKVKGFIKSEDGKVSRVIEYESGTRVEFPMNQDGSIKFFDDSKLLKKGGANNDR